jgi:hypothetical protein
MNERVAKSVRMRRCECPVCLRLSTCRVKSSRSLEWVSELETEKVSLSVLEYIEENRRIWCM